MRRALLAVLPLLAGCYIYAPIDAGSVQPGTSVRARVSGTAAERLGPLLGTSDARLLSGRVLETRTDTMIVEVPTITQATLGSSMEALHQRVSIPRAELLELETRRLDRWRTAAMAGSVAIIVGTIAIKSLKNDPGTDRPPGSGGGGENRAPRQPLRP